VGKGGHLCDVFWQLAAVLAMLILVPAARLQETTMMEDHHDGRNHHDDGRHDDGRR